MVKAKKKNLKVRVKKNSKGDIVDLDPKDLRIRALEKEYGN